MKIYVSPAFFYEKEDFIIPFEKNMNVYIDTELELGEIKIENDDGSLCYIDMRDNDAGD